MPRNSYYDEDLQDKKKYYADECPECGERKFFKEQPRKKRNEEEFTPDKGFFPPCPDWYKCPPPWFFCKPEQEEKKDCRRDDCCRGHKDDCCRDHKDDCRRDDCCRGHKDDCCRDHKDDCCRDMKDDCDKRKEIGCEIEAYGYVYSLTATAVTILTNNDVVFTNNGPMDCITHTPNTTQVFIKKSGVYQIFYSVNTTAGVGATISLAVNGAVDASTTIPIAAAAANTSGKALLNLRCGDFLTLRNSSALSITLAVAPAVGAQLTLERLDEIESCCNFG